jgi:hypothetical protein
LIEDSPYQAPAVQRRERGGSCPGDARGRLSGGADCATAENNRRGAATEVPSEITTSITCSGRGGAILAGQSIDDTTTETADLAALQRAATTLAPIVAR